MPVSSLTPAKINTIKKLRTEMCGSDIAKKIGVSRHVVTKFLRDNNLTMPRETMFKWRAEKLARPFTKREDRYIIRHVATSTIKKIAAHLHRTGMYVSQRAKELGYAETILANALKNRIKPGNMPPNAGKKQSEYMTSEEIEKTKPTRFQKGRIPHNAIDFKDGDISIRQSHASEGGKSYKWVRLGLGKWNLLQIVNWEKENKKKLPVGHCLWFKDGDTMNCDISNLELITRAENLKRNRMAFLNAPSEIRTTLTLINKLNKAIHGKKQIK